MTLLQLLCNVVSLKLPLPFRLRHSRYGWEATLTKFFPSLLYLLPGYLGLLHNLSMPRGPRRIIFAMSSTVLPYPMAPLSV